MKKLILLCSFGLFGSFVMAEQGVIEPVKSCHIINGYYNDDDEMVITHNIEIEGISCAEFWAMIEAIMSTL